MHRFSLRKWGEGPHCINNRADCSQKNTLVCFSSHGLKQNRMQCSPFLSAQRVKEFFKVVEDLLSSVLTMSTQCTIWIRNLPHLSHTDSFAITSSLIQGSDFGIETKFNVEDQSCTFVHYFFSFTS